VGPPTCHPLPLSLPFTSGGGRGSQGRQVGDTRASGSDRQVTLGRRRRWSREWSMAVRAAVGPYLPPPSLSPSSLSPPFLFTGASATGCRWCRTGARAAAAADGGWSGGGGPPGPTRRLPRSTSQSGGGGSCDSNVAGAAKLEGVGRWSGSATVGRR
jgi:hypothetical protein